MIPTTALSALCPKKYDKILPPDWLGFSQVCPEEASAPSLPVYQLENEAQRAWSFGAFWKKPSPSVGPLGCYFLPDVEVWRPGINLYAGAILDDESVPTEVALSIARGDPNFEAQAKAPVRAVDRPALIIAGAGYNIWGHWLAEFLPRAAIACALLGDDCKDYAVPLPHDAPAWVERLLSDLCGIAPEAIVKYRPGAERLAFSRAVIPTFGFTKDYTYHSFVRDFYQSKRPPRTGASRRLCISRGSGNYAGNRPFLQRELFEREAALRGFEIIRPEETSLSQQIATFSEASLVVGEYGSAMHNTVFSGQNTVVGCIGHWNAIQMRLNEVCSQSSVFLTRGCHWPQEGKSIYIDVTDADIKSFLDLVVSLDKPT